MKIAAIYVSVSNQDQDERMSGLRVYAVQKHWRVLEYRERRAKGRTRPVYEQMLRHASRGRFDVVLVDSLDCFARSLAELSVAVASLYQLGIRFVAANEDVDIDPETPESRAFLSAMAVLVNAGEKMISRSVREGVTNAKGKGVHCGRPRHSFPIAQALRLRKLGLSIRAVAARLRLPASTVVAALKDRSKSEVDVFGKSVPTSTAGKRARGMRGTRTRRTFPLAEAVQLRESGLSIRSVAAKIRFPVSTVAAALKAHSLVEAQKLAVKLERAARTSLKRAEGTTDERGDEARNCEKRR
jgi:DNA invertase Pin-like site-specific DNA recombinase